MPVKKCKRKKMTHNTCENPSALFPRVFSTWCLSSEYYWDVILGRAVMCWKCRQNRQSWKMSVSFCWAKMFHCPRWFDIYWHEHPSETMPMQPSCVSCLENVHTAAKNDHIWVPFSPNSVRWNSMLFMRINFMKVVQAWVQQSIADAVTPVFLLWIVY